MRCVSDTPIFLIAAEESCERLRRLLKGHALRIAVRSAADVIELLEEMGEDSGHVVVMMLTDEPSSLAACRLLIRRLDSARLIVLHDSSPARDGMEGETIPLALTSLLQCLGQDSGGDSEAEGIEGAMIGQGAPGRAPLSAREGEILFCLAHGQANKHIARRLDITEATVKVHVKTILRKLHLTNRTQAAIWAVQNGFTWNHESAPAAGEPLFAPARPEEALVPGKLG
ncbi:MAG: response regulator transcription factor [Sphingobium sp.]